MGLYTYDSTPIPKSDRIPKLVENLYAKMPEIESARAVLITESYKQTENEPMIIRRAKAFQHILENIPITIRDLELVVGSAHLPQEDARHFRSSLTSGWRQSLIQLKQEVLIRSTSLSRRRRN